MTNTFIKNNDKGTMQLYIQFTLLTTYNTYVHHTHTYKLNFTFQYFLRLFLRIQCY